MDVYEGSERYVDVFGLAGHKEKQLQIVTAQALIHTQKGEVVAIFHQMALLGKGKSILSCIQMEDYGAVINDRPRTLSNGKQRIVMDDYQVPLEFKNGLPYLHCRKPTKHEVANLPHVIFTADVDWDPTKYDSPIGKMEDWYDNSIDYVDNDDPLDAVGEHSHRVVATHHQVQE